MFINRYNHNILHSDIVASSKSDKHQHSARSEDGRLFYDGEWYGRGQAICIDKKDEYPTRWEIWVTSSKIHSSPYWSLCSTLARRLWVIFLHRLSFTQRRNNCNQSGWGVVQTGRWEQVKTLHLAAPERQIHHKACLIHAKPDCFSARQSGMFDSVIYCTVCHVQILFWCFKWISWCIDCFRRQHSWCSCTCLMQCHLYSYYYYKQGQKCNIIMGFVSTLRCGTFVFWY